LLEQLELPKNESSPFMTDLLIESVGDFLGQIARIKAAWFKDEELSPWYRGQKRAEWPLLPSLYRIRANFDEILEDEMEDEIREEFIVRAPIFSDFKPAGDDDWEWYFLMQHYGAPSRLLDWTQGALLALYFAVKNNPGHYDSAVWVLDPYRLNERSIDRYEVIPPSAQGISAGDKRLVKRWLPTRFTGSVIPKMPIAVFPTHIARRISTQRSCFTVHGKDFGGLDRLEHTRRPLLCKLLIPSFRVRPIKRELIDGGIDEATIFPDLDGLGRAVGEAYSLDQDIWPHRNVMTRLQPSKSYFGQIGVFAIFKIKKGQQPFRGENEEVVWLEKKLFVQQRMSKSSRALYKEFSLERAGRIGCPTNFNRLTVAWYLKRARSGVKANVRPDHYFEFHALRDIVAGEELIADFSPK
jgi:hypothetical protein